MDTYSWSNRGVRWDVPEWLSFVLFALAYRAVRFLGVWLVMASVTVATVMVVWRYLAPRLGLRWAFPLCGIMVLAMSDCIQERPYIYTYFWLAVSLALIMSVRSGKDGYARNPNRLLLLLPIAVVWANLHQGVIVLVGLLCAFGLGDALDAMRRRDVETRSDHAVRARWMLGLSAGCFLAALINPYGWGIYRNIAVTLGDPHLMSSVTEWKPITVLPFGQMQPFLLILTVSALAFSLSRRSAGDIFPVCALTLEAILHARNIALFAIGAIVISAPYLQDIIERLRGRVVSTSPPLLISGMLAFFTVLCVSTLGMVTAATLRRTAGPLGYNPERIAEAVARVPSYPADAVAFMDREAFPSNLRLLNNFEIGGYLMWTIPREPVFVDGRLDVYTGRTFDDNLILAGQSGTARWNTLVARYDFDCVITNVKRQGEAFEKDPHFALVYRDPLRPHHKRCRIFLARKPQFAALISRCLHDRPGDSDTPKGMAN